MILRCFAHSLSRSLALSLSRSLALLLSRSLALSLSRSLARQLSRSLTRSLSRSLWLRSAACFLICAEWLRAYPVRSNSRSLARNEANNRSGDAFSSVTAALERSLSTVGALGALWGALGPLLGFLGSLLEALGALLERSRGVPRRLWSALGASRSTLGGLLGRTLELWERLGAPMATLGAAVGGPKLAEATFSSVYLGFAQFPGFEASGSDRKTPPILRDPAPIVDLCIKCTELC